MLPARAGHPRAWKGRASSDAASKNHCKKKNTTVCDGVSFGKVNTMPVLFFFLVLLLCNVFVVYEEKYTVVRRFSGRAYISEGVFMYLTLLFIFLRTLEFIVSVVKNNFFYLSQNFPLQWVGRMNFFCNEVNKLH